MVKAVLFDMDGVLTDSEPVINAAAIAGLREFGVEASPADFEPFVGTGEDNYIGGVARKYGKAYLPEMKKRVYEIYLDILPGMIRSFPGVHELIATLEATGIRLALVSSADRVKVEANLKAIAIDIEKFGAVVVGEDVSRKKPAPDCFLRAAEILGCTPAACCVVEDAINGVKAAKNAGMRCVAVAQSFSVDRLALAEPDVIRPDIAAITLRDLGIETGR